MKKKTGMKLEAVHPVNSGLNSSIPSGRSNSVSGQKSLMSNRTKKQTVPDSKIYMGLCSCCRFSSGCTFPRDSVRPVLQCEEFDGISKPENITMKWVERPHTPRISGPPLSPQHQSPLRGLCADCDGRNTCVYPKPEGGVWHCEEFK